ncbi:MAG: glycosyltransferase family 8 protein [Alphaproteobacteria bacterium]|nr:glycosyltransferase family 8 protein [Alphaproteobacteria bacterium]
MTRQPLNIFLVGSDGFTAQNVVAMTSILMNTKSEIDFYIIDCGLAADDVVAMKRVKEKFSNFKSLTMLDADVNKEFKGCSRWHGYLDCWARFLFPRLAPNVDKALYIDGDIVALNDVAKLFELDMEGKALAAAPEVGVNSKESTRNRRRKKFGYSENHQYFGSGTLMFDCKKWREGKLLEKIVKIGREWGRALACPDQDALNILFADNYAMIDNIYVATSSDTRYIERADYNKYIKLQKNVVIRHFNLSKPWNTSLERGKYFRLAHFDNWWYYASHTDFAAGFQALPKGLPIRKVKLFGIPFLKIKTRTGQGRVVLLFDFIPILKMN